MPFIALLWLAGEAALWGTQFADTTYIPLRYAYNLAQGRGWLYEAGLTGQMPPTSPLPSLLLGWLVPAAHLPLVSLLLSVLGWAVVLYVLWQVGDVPQSSAMAVTAVLLITHPIMPATLGSTLPWAVAVGWLLLWRWHDWHWGRRTAVSLLLLAVQYDSSTLLLLIMLWSMEGKRISWRAMLPVLVTAVAGGIFAFSHFGLPFSFHLWGWRPELALRLHESQFYWLFVPFALLGGVPLVRRGQRPYSLFGIWGIAAAVSGSDLASLLLTVALLLLTGQGVMMLWHWLRTRFDAVVVSYVGIMAVSLLLIAQLTTIWWAYQSRQPEQTRLESEVAAWLQAHTAPDDVLFSTRRLAYLADRPVLPAYPLPQTEQELATLLPALDAASPAYLVSSYADQWLPILQSGWVQDRYEDVTQFTAPALADAPYTIWAYQHSPFDTAVTQPANVIIGTAMKLVGYHVQPTVIQPGEDVYVTLQLQATQPITTGVITDVRLAYTLDDWAWAWKQQLTPHTIAAAWWQPGQTITERIYMEIEDNVPVGAYEIQVLWWPSVQETLALYQDEDVNPLDRVRLGYIVIPPPLDTTQMEAVKARFADEIQLTGMKIGGDWQPGGQMQVTLFWEALQVPSADYTVFVHLLGDGGTWLAGHDGKPVDGRYTTLAWQPAQLIQDDHLLTLPADLPPGHYDIAVGLYRLETGERLPVWDAQNEEQPGRAIPIYSFTR